MKVLETALCRINYSENLEKLVVENAQLINKKIIEYELLFGISIKEQIVANYFDTLEKFREFIYEIRGERDSLPEYATGTFDNDMVNIYVNPTFQ